MVGLLDDPRLLWIFSGPEGEDIGLTLDGFAQALSVREPEPFTSIWDSPADGPYAGTTMTFAITLAGELVEGIVSTRSEGVSLREATATEAVEFAIWMRDALVADRAVLTVNTRQGTEDDLPDIPVTGRPDSQLAEGFNEHARAVA
ncbi:hypothetical protein [Streptacidiphilus sp. MAP5-3]|uniref:hypothetical protein n=1 Tax=unclassified Streptacidiphilus TaxID=2643834 RepID=UPI0035136013